MFRAAGKSFGLTLKTVVVSGDVHVPFAMVTDLGGAGPLKVTIGSLPDEALMSGHQQKFKKHVRILHQQDDTQLDC